MRILRDVIVIVIVGERVAECRDVKSCDHAKNQQAHSYVARLLAHGNLFVGTGNQPGINPGARSSPGSNRSSRIYQSLYFVPSRAVFSDFVYTSKTACPPHESESGSSWFDRNPHSKPFVSGSRGILRRNLIF